MNENYSKLLTALSQCVKDRTCTIEYQHLLIAKSAIDKTMKANEKNVINSQNSQ